MRRAEEACSVSRSSLTREPEISAVFPRKAGSASGIAAPIPGRSWKDLLRSVSVNIDRRVLSIREVPVIHIETVRRHMPSRRFKHSRETNLGILCGST